jgi:omega-6 fatty acid desaturase (delta-12 desaturase)
MTQDQVYVPRTRSQRGLPPLNPDGESLLGASIRKEVLKELHEALGDSPIGTFLGSAFYLVCPCVYFQEEPNMKLYFSSLAGPCT